MTLAQFLPANVFAALLVFARIGTAMMLLPGFGEVYVPQRFRLLLAFIMSVLLLPILAPILPPLPSNPSKLVIMLGSEIAIGAFIGTLTRFMMAALETAGQVVSFQTGLSNAVMFNPIQANEGSIPSTFYSVLGVVVIFLSNLHYMILRGLVDSYAVFPPGHLPPVGDLSKTVAQAAAGSFQLAIEMAAPFVALGLAFFVGMGLVARLVPQIQIMFVAMPLQIMGGLLLFALIIAAGMGWFLEVFIQQWHAIVPG